jgi:phospholipid transport system substrate-binding protein
MSSRRSLLAALLFAGSLLAGGTLPLAAAPTQAPEAFVDRFGEQAVAALAATKDDPAARRQRFATLMEGDLDMPRIAALVLGRAWRTAGPEERARFTQVFQEHLIATYSRRFDSYAGERLEVGGQTAAGDDVLVNSRVTPKGGEPVDVVWRLREKDDRWRIIDASVAGVSMVVTWRNEFAAVIEREGLDGLIRRLEEQVGS